MAQYGKYLPLRKSEKRESSGVEAPCLLLDSGQFEPSQKFSFAICVFCGYSVGAIESSRTLLGPADWIWIPSDLFSAGNITVEQDSIQRDRPLRSRTGSWEIAEGRKRWLPEA